MKLRINGFENEIQFDDNNVNVLEIFDAKCFEHIIEVLNEKINEIENNEIILLNDENEEISCNKNIFMTFDLYNIEYNSKKILSKIYDIISENIEKSQDITINEISTKLRNYIIEEINELPFEFTMKSELDIKEILKLYELKIDSSNYTTILQRVEIIIDLIANLKIAQILVIPNLKIYLNEDELVELYKYSLYNEVKLLTIERINDTTVDKKLKYEKILRIDENFNDQLI